MKLGHPLSCLSTPVQKFANVLLVLSSGYVFVGREFGKEGREIGLGELPFKGLGGGFPVGWNVEQSRRPLVQTGEVVRGEDFSLHDGAVDLDLMEPAGMDWSVNKC